MNKIFRASMTRTGLVFLLLVGLTFTLRAQPRPTGGRVTASSIAAHDTIWAFLNNHWIVLKDTAEFTNLTLWDSIAQPPTSPPNHQAGIFFSGGYHFKIIYHDGTVHDLDFYETHFPSLTWGTPGNPVTLTTDSEWVAGFSRNGVLDSIKVFRTGGTSVTFNATKIHSGSASNLFSSNFTMGTTDGLVTGIQNNTFVNGDAMWFVLKSISGSPTYIKVQAYYHLTQ